MGILSDTLEDNRERAGQLLRSIEPLPTQDCIWPSPALERCSLCGRQLLLEDLEQHVHEHAGVGSYVMANRRIVRDAAYLDKCLNSLEIYVYGDSEAQAEVAIGDKTIWLGKVRGRRAFGNQFETITNEELVVRVASVNGQRFHRLYLGTQPLVRHQDIDRLAFNTLFQPLHENSEPDFDEYDSEIKKLMPTPLEELYKNSLYDYALGFALERSNKPQKGHFESALYGLTRFRTDFAVAGQRVLALRMNCFGLLADCTPTSRFFMAAVFLCRPYDAVPARQMVTTFESEYGVYVDSLALGFLDVIQAYYSADPAIFGNMLSALWARVENHDTNSHAKISLLGARYWRRIGDSSRAREEYQMLLNDPDFAAEARDFLA